MTGGGGAGGGVGWREGINQIILVLRTIPGLAQALSLVSRLIITGDCWAADK